MAKLIEREDGVVADPNAGEETYVDLTADNPIAVSTVDEADMIPDPTHEQVGTQDTSTPDEDIPNKYKGKSLKDVIEMHQEAEKWAGRQSGELGDLRKTVDSLIQAQLTTQSQVGTNAAPVEEEVDFFADPEAAIERAIANHPSVKAAETTAANLHQNAAMLELERKHPDMAELMQSEDFGEWVTASQFRTKLLQQAHHQYDTAAADELFSLYKERQSVVNTAVESDKAGRKQAVQQASTGDTRGAGATPRKRLYKRHDIINLMKTNPSKYHSMQDEIMLAYAEGRVR
jgi:hypothetical protein